MIYGTGGGGDDDGRFSALVIAARGNTHASQIEDAVRMAGGRMLGRVDWDMAVARLDATAGAPLLVLDARSVEETLLVDVLARLDAIAAARELPVICAIDTAQVDVATALLTVRGAAFLCDPAPGDWIAGLAVSSVARDLRVADHRVSETEAARLARLNQEVARIADVLARLAKRDAGPAPQALAEARQAFADRPREPVEIDPQEIRRVIRARRLRDREFGEGLFEDPAWDMMLDLFAANLERAQVSVSSLCIAAGVAPTTALRWIGKMSEAGLFERQPDPFDRRRAFMGLSARGLDGMRAYVSTARSLGLPLV